MPGDVCKIIICGILDFVPECLGDLRHHLKRLLDVHATLDQWPSASIVLREIMDAAKAGRWDAAEDKARGLWRKVVEGALENAATFS